MRNYETCVVKMLYGSKMYGLDDAQSDTDYKSIHIPGINEMILGEFDHVRIMDTKQEEHAKNTPDDVDNKSYSIQKWFSMAKQGDLMCLDMLHAPDSAIVHDSVEWLILRGNRAKFLSTNIEKYLAYINKQVSKYAVDGTRLGVMKALLDDAMAVDPLALVRDNVGVFYRHMSEQNGFVAVRNSMTRDNREIQFVELFGRRYAFSTRMKDVQKSLEKIYSAHSSRVELAKNNEGIDWKAVHHGMRVSYQLIDLFNKGHWEYPLPATDMLIDVKRGRMDYMTQALPRLHDLINNVKSAAARNKVGLPSEIDQDSCDRLMLDLVKRHF